MTDGEGTQSSTGGGRQARQPTEEEVRAALEEELKRVRVDDVILQTVVSLLNLGGRRIGLAPGSESERDLVQAHTAIEGVRRLLPLIEEGMAGREGGPQDLRAIREALSQLQMAYAKLRGEPGGAPEPEGEPPKPQEQPGSAQRSGRLWVPGQ